MAQENLGTDINGEVDFSLDPPVSCYDVALAATTVVTVSTPVNFNRAFLGYAVGTNVWMTMDGSAPVVPSTGAFTKQELNPAIRKISMSGQTLKFISDSASSVNIRFDLSTNSGYETSTVSTV
jgi:hypothetical protein